MRYSKLFNQSGAAKPTVWIGKDGVTVPVLDQIRIQLEANQLVKVKVQRSRLSEELVRDVAERVARETSSTLIDTRGRTFALYRKKMNK